MKKTAMLLSALLVLLSGCAPHMTTPDKGQLSSPPQDLSNITAHPWTGRILSFVERDHFKNHGYGGWTQHPGQSPEALSYDRFVGKKAKVEGEVIVGTTAYVPNYFLKCRLVDSGEPVYIRMGQTVVLDWAPFGTAFDAPPAAGAPLVTEEYDKFRNMTVVKIPSADSRLSHRFKFQFPQFGAFAIYPGKKPKSRPESATISFVSQSADWGYLKCHHVAMLADGKRISMERTKHDGTVGNGYVIEHIYSTLNWAEVLKLSSAKTVEAKICNTEITLSPQNMVDLKEFARLLTPQSAH